MPTLRSSRLGVSLVEALVALAVMAFGMLSLVGVQATLRLNSDLAKQRTEATRIATEDIEGLRLFTAVNPVSGQPGVSWAEIASSTVASYVPPGNVGNTSYQVIRTVNTGTGTLRKVISVQVNWIDRTGVAQSVTVDTVIAGIDPVLSGVLSSKRSSINNQVSGRDATIPVEAVNFGNADGRSAFKPFDQGTVVWLFNNISGEIVGRCPGITTAQAALRVADVTGCPIIRARLLGGLVFFDLRLTPTPLPASASETPMGPQILPLSATTPVMFPTSATSPVDQITAAECVSDTPASATAATQQKARGYAVTYYCLVYPSTASGWGGRLDVVLAGSYPNGNSLPGTTTTSDYKVCRYTTASNGYTANPDHPQSYCVEKSSPAPTSSLQCIGRHVADNLINQNFLVVSAAQSCPSDVAADPANGDYINSNTLQHQP
jgi:Tfp pilus assembly protein PilV